MYILKLYQVYVQSPKNLQIDHFLILGMYIVHDISTLSRDNI